MITEISLLGHLRIEFFCLKMDFKKKSQMCLTKNLKDWIRVDRTTFNQIIDEVKKVKDKNIYIRPNRGPYINANDSYKLIQDLEFGEITHEEALEKNNECH